MRKLGLALLIISIISFMVSPSFAQSPRQPTSSEGKSGFTNIAVRGLDDTGTDGSTDPGTPGYFEMTSGIGSVFYLFVDSAGNLRIASDIAVGTDTSPATVNWDDASGRIVGSQ